MLTDMQVIEQQDHEQMIERRHLWSYGGAALPLKRWRNNTLDTACIFNADGEPRYRIRIGVVFEVAFGGRMVVDMPFRDYDSAAAIVADGWEVD